MKSILLKILGYSVYLFYLYIFRKFHLTYIIVPAVFLIWPLSPKFKTLLLLFFLCLDYSSTFAFLNPYLVTVNGLENYLKSAPSYFQFFVPAIILFSVAIVFLLGQLHFKIRQIKTYLSIPYIIIMILFMIWAFDYSINSLSLFNLFILTMTLFIAKKFWLIYLLGLERIPLNQFSWSQIKAIAFPGPVTREQFSIENYEVDKEAAFRLAVKLSLIFGMAHLIFNQVVYQLGVVSETPFLIHNNYVVFNKCRLVISPHNIDAVLSLSVMQRIGCIFIDQGLHGIIRHLFLDTFFFIIVASMMGVRFTFPYGNFFKSKNFLSFMYNVFYYYSIIIFRVFVIEFYHFILDIFNKRSRLFLIPATFLGVVIGGICFHLWADFILIQIQNKEPIWNIISLPHYSFYFGSLGLACVLAEMTKKLQTPKLRIINVFAYFLFLIVIRFCFARYFESIPLKNKLFVLQSLFL